jgi:hypothetical protein
MVEDDDAVVGLEGRGDAQPHVLVAPEAVREDDRLARGVTEDPDIVSLEDVH